MSRLEATYPVLAEKFGRASLAQRQALMYAACELAVKQAGLDRPEIDAALAMVRQRSSASADVVAAVGTLVEQFDEQYFALQEEADEGRASVDDYLVPFSQARAASAVLYAIKDDSLDANMEAIYEAMATTDAPERMMSVLVSMLA